MDTRERIIQKGLELFNAQGFGSVTMREIADAIGVDRRNVTYHFDKEGLLSAITSQMWDQLRTYRAHKKDFPSFENLDREVELYHKLQKDYAFVFLDAYVIRHPVVQAKFKEFSATMIADCQQAVAFAISQGNMIDEPVPGTYDALCTAVWTLSFSWLQVNIVQEAQHLDQLRRLIWSMIVPYFTEKGITAFQTFFGKEFYARLGQPFNIEVKTLMF